MKKIKVILSGAAGSGKRELASVIKQQRIGNTNLSEDLAEVNHPSLALPSKMYIDTHTEVSIYRVRLDKQIGTFFRAFKGQHDIAGVIVLVNCTMPDAPQELLRYIKIFQSHDINNMVVGLTCEDCEDCHLSTEDALQTLEKKNVIIPVFPVDSSSYDDAVLMVEALVCSYESMVA